jgi:ketosteroid isomerase-like protein
VRGGFDAFQEGDLSGMLELMADDLVTYRADPDGATYHGKEGFLQATADWTEDFTEWSVIPEEFIDAGDCVLVRVRQMARGEASGIPIEGEFWFVLEWDASRSPMPDIGGVYRGKNEVRQFWREWLAAWETIEFEYELVDAGDSVVALIDQRMRGRSTGIEVPFGKYAQVWTLRDGLLVHWEAYASQSEALEAARLSG